jgi:hypothetical protein
MKRLSHQRSHGQGRLTTRIVRLCLHVRVHTSTRGSCAFPCSGYGEVVVYVTLMLKTMLTELDAPYGFGNVPYV